MNIRRFAVVSGFVMLCAALVSGASPADDPWREQPADEELDRALRGSTSLMFGGHVTSETGSRGDLVITSALNVQGKPQKVRVRPGTTTVFRTDAGLDDFTRQGGWYWRCGKKEGTSQFNPADNSWFKLGSPKGRGLLIRVVYQLDGTVHWYPLHIDLRC